MVLHIEIIEKREGNIKDRLIEENIAYTLWFWKKGIKLMLKLDVSILFRLVWPQDIYLYKREYIRKPPKAKQVISIEKVVQFEEVI